MTTALPPIIRQKLEQTLSQWRHWLCDPPLTDAPRAECILGAGQSNFSVRVALRSRRWVVRLDGIIPSVHGLNRQMEWRALDSAAAAAIAPTPRYFNPDIGSLVCDYLPPDGEQRHEPEQTAALLRAIHQLPPRHQRLDLGERLLRYEKRLLAGRHALREPVLTLGEPVRALLQPTPDTDLVLCHNDLLGSNRLRSGGRLWALDWEYCAMGSRWHDLAVVIAGDDMPARARDRLLRAYLQARPTADQQAAVAAHGCVYRYLELLWYLAPERPALDTAQLQRKLQRLRAALAG